MLLLSLSVLQVTTTTTAAVESPVGAWHATCGINTTCGSHNDNGDKMDKTASEVTTPKALMARAATSSNTALSESSIPVTTLTIVMAATAQKQIVENQRQI